MILLMSASGNPFFPGSEVVVENLLLLSRFESQAVMEKVGAHLAWESHCSQLPFIVFLPQP